MKHVVMEFDELGGGDPGGYEFGSRRILLNQFNGMSGRSVIMFSYGEYFEQVQTAMIWGIRALG